MRIILVGFGTVGQSLAQLLHNDGKRLSDTYGFAPEIVAIQDRKSIATNENGLDPIKVLKTKKKLGVVGHKLNRTHNSLYYVRSVDAEVLVECTPSNFDDGEPGMSNIKTGLIYGKHVVTSNKGPLALSMPALMELATHHKRRLLFSGTVGAGTPFLSLAHNTLQGLKINEIHGILNGTTNYILTWMEERSLSFEQALKEAQRLGYAETDPSNDVDGYDSAAKTVILANWIFKHKINLNDMEITGIRQITQSQLQKAAHSKKKLKLVCRISKSRATVKPEAVPVDDPICVKGSLNALTFSTELAGDLTLTGPGAGGSETASAILRDLIEIRQEYSL